MLTAPPIADRNIRRALARSAYHAGTVRIADRDVAGYKCLVASRRGVFAVRHDHAKTVLHGLFFGIRRHGDHLYLFEACDAPYAATDMGRIVRLSLTSGRMTDPQILARGLDNQCHQLAIIDDLICVVDTGNQRILRFDLAGRAIDTISPFPAAERGATNGDYLHINGIAQIDERIAIMLHNGTQQPPKQSEIAWLDRNWRLIGREIIDGHGCHDIVESDDGDIWHCASQSGELIASGGKRIKVSPHMTRGLALGRDGVIVGSSLFGSRGDRDTLGGSVIFLDRDLRKIAEVEVDGAPTDLISLAGSAV